MFSIVSQTISEFGKFAFSDSQALFQISVAKTVSNPAFSNPKSIPPTPENTLTILGFIKY
jgi:hypothetical protein